MSNILTHPLSDKSTDLASLRSVELKRPSILKISQQVFSYLDGKRAGATLRESILIDEVRARFEVLHDAAIGPKRLLKEALFTDWGLQKSMEVGTQSVGLRRP